MTLTMPKNEPAAVTTSWRALPVILLAQFLAVVDFFIVNVALPSIGADLRAGPAGVQFVVAGYGLAYACCLVAGGRLGDAFGRRRLFVLGLAAFTLTSLLCGLAPSASALIAARVLQGVAAGAMVPQVLATIQATYAGGMRARALGLFGATIGAGSVAGELIGGVLLRADVAGTGWRAIFLVNVPLGIAGLFAARLVPQSRSSSPAPVDPRGALLLAGTLALLLAPLSVGRELHWPLWTIAALLAVPLLGLALWRDQRAAERDERRAPMLPPSLLREPAVRRGLAVALLYFPTVGGFMFVFAVLAQSGLGWSPLRAGLGLTPMAAGFLVMSLAAARIVARRGGLAIVVGAWGFAAGLGVLAMQALLWYDRLSLLTVAPAMLVTGLGGGLVMVPLFGAVLATVPPQVAGAASGALVTAQQAGLAAGVATVGSLFVAVAERSGWAGGAVTGLAACAVLASACAVACARLPRR
ncbi:MAG TPA: MFS transporter [Dactylosporangium sp.]|jgi:MFS family permease|nr:MFS transporter [Dactylosporangium sp.]